MTIELPGFAEPVVDAQICFRAILDAMAHPGRIVHLGSNVQPPAPLARATGAALLTLADSDTPVWLDPATEPCADWVRFHCGSPSSPPERACFGVCLTLPPLDMLSLGSHDGPETSTTIILQRPSLEAGPLLQIKGPGLQSSKIVRLGLSDDFAIWWKPNHASFPRGVDLIICCGEYLAALPRSVHVEAA